ncbi:LLM class flavin-dependent oxidoreductase [Amycolatopsis jejuensis]|uniref:LLM class flavin-dependent oxidoreductase n=1 Tax=Amycolatopsis jejuensis TaxID=330084 RepID=UPI000524B46D|nr:LLM class flavin-dependent oxidoreductase [Amycolatopsis jejuensis]
MKFGFSHHPTNPYREHVELVRAAEGMGFDHAWVPDQTFLRDPYVLLAAMGSATSSITLGLGVTNPYTRHPAIAARAIATAEEFAPGRTVFGIGAGNPKEVVRALELQDSFVVARCEEMAAAVRALLRGETLAVDGEHYTYHDVRLGFEVPRPIPLYLAGRGPKMLRAAGRVADGVIVGSIATESGYRYALEQVAKGAADVGRSMAELDLVAWTVVEVTKDRARSLGKYRGQIAHIIANAPDSALRRIGVPCVAAAAIKEAYRGSGSAGAFVTDECVDAFAVIGDADYCRRRISYLAEVGVSQVSVLLPYDRGLDEYRVQLEVFAREIVRHFR